MEWLPDIDNFSEALRAATVGPSTAREAYAALRLLAGHRLDFAQTGRLDKRLIDLAGRERDMGVLGRIRVAVLGSLTLDHLLPSIRIGGLRRDLLVEARIGAYGQYRQDLLDPKSWLAGYRPDAVYLALHAEAVLTPLALGASEAEVEAADATAVQSLIELWRAAKSRFGATVVQQTLLDATDPVFGHFDSSVPSSPGRRVARLNEALRRAAAQEGALILDLDPIVARVGRSGWFDPALWAHGKQEVRHQATPLLGDHVARLLAALRGLSKKCLVLDLDNTLWGGVVGDDGLAGIKIGQGDAQGESFLAFQRFCKSLSERGVILAVCSKNDQENAEQPFRELPDMALRLGDFAAFVANWNDKAGNLKAIAEQLNIGVDSLVFFDDNPAERALVRRELPMVGVPEVPDEPAYFVERLAAAGYFEAVAFTEDDRQRARQYAGNLQRTRHEAQASDIDGFLRSLEMELRVGPIDETGLPRVAQLINKTNQFNLTTRRRSEAEVAVLMADPHALTFQARLIDRFGDNGLISVVIAIPGDEPAVYAVDTWLMSCRVLGRQVEHALLGVLAEAVKARGGRTILGSYRPTAKNGMVRDHYAKLGFAADGESSWRLDLEALRIPKTHIRIASQS